MRPFRRRTFLRGAGGGLVGLPLLGSLRARAEETTFPKRLVFFYTPNGVSQQTWWPTEGATERDFTLNASHAALQPHKDDLILMRGVHMKAGGPGGPHARGMGTALTGQELQAGDMPSNDGKLAGWADGISVDQHIANQIGRTTVFPSLQVGMRSDNYRSTNMSRMSYAGPAQPLTPISDPLALWQRLSPGLPEGPTRTGADYQLTVLDTVREQFRSLKAQVGTEDQVRLESHMEMVSALSRRLQMAADGQGAQCELPPAPQVADVNQDGNPDTDNDLTMEDVADLQIDLLAMSLICDLTRVATFQFNNAWDRITYPWVGSLRTGHDLSHSGISDDVSQAAWSNVATYHAGRFARLIEALKAAPEGDGSVFDHTVIVWLTEVAIGASHVHTDMPYVLAGGLSGTFDTGRFVTFDDRWHNDLLITLMNGMDVPGNTFGKPELCTGPMTELFL